MKLIICFLQNFLFTLILINLIFPSQCSPQIPPSYKPQIKINGIIHDAPFEFEAKIGDTLIIEVLGGGSINGENPYKLIVDRPLTLNPVYPEAPDSIPFQVRLSESSFISRRIFEFEVWINKISQDFILTAYQCVLSYNASWRQAGLFTLEYISGSSQLTNIPSYSIKWDPPSNKFMFASAAGLDTIKTDIRIGRFRITNIMDFAFGLPVDLNFNLTPPLNTIFTGENFYDITANGSLISLSERHKVIILIN